MEKRIVLFYSICFCVSSLFRDTKPIPYSPEARPGTPQQQQQEQEEDGSDGQLGRWSTRQQGSQSGGWQGGPGLGLADFNFPGHSKQLRAAWFWGCLLVHKVGYRMAKMAELRGKTGGELEAVPYLTEAWGR